MQLRWLIERYEYSVVPNKRWSSEQSEKRCSDSAPKLQFRYDPGGPWFDVPTEIEVSTEEERRAKHERQKSEHNPG